MIIKKIIPILFLTLWLAACGASAPETPTPTVTSTPVPLPTATPQPLTDCFAVEAVATPASTGESLFPPVSESDRVLGVQNAAVTFTVYCDLQSRGCATLLSSLTGWQAEYPDEVRIVYRDFPQIHNPGHELSALAAQAVQAARIQGGDWDLQALLFADQAAWGTLTESAFVTWVADQASMLGMDGAQLQADLRSDALAAQVAASFDEGVEIGIPVTPFLLINDQIYSGVMELASLRQIMQLAMLSERQFTSCPPQVIDLEKEYLAFLETEYGEVVIQFYTQQAPVAVNNFVFLAREGWFDGITFHRVIPDFVAQTGDPSGTGQGAPGYFFADEIDESLTFDKPGVVAMANLGPNTNGSQFFISYAALPSLNGKHTIFGQVISGIDVLEKLTSRDEPFGDVLPPGDLLLSVRIEER